jgi:polar amino acid transport system substrate-binding protein
MGLHAKIVSTRFDSLFDDLKAKHFDVVMSAVAISPERQQVVDFVPYLNVGESLLVQVNNPLSIASLADLCGQNVGTQEGTVEQSDLQTASNACQKAGKPAINIITRQSPDDVTQLLLDQSVVATYQDSIVADYYLSLHRGDITLGALLNGQREGIVVRKGDTSMLNTIQATLNQLISDGTYHHLAQKWNLVNEEIK